MAPKNIPNHILQAIKEKKPFHEQIPHVGKIVFNKVVPYFFLYRSPPGRKDRMLRDLARSQLASVVLQYESGAMDHWIIRLAEAIQAAFGKCLIVEVWTNSGAQSANLEIQLCQKAALPMAEYIQKNISLEAPDLSSVVAKQRAVSSHPDYPALFTLKQLQSDNIYLMGLAVQTKYIDPRGHVLPILQRHYRESLAKVLSRLFFEYIRRYTDLHPAHFKLNVQKEITAEVFALDKALTTENLRFDFLLLVTPTNAAEEWLAFKKNNYSKMPRFQYRPIPIDPDLVKRDLYNLPIEDIYDPTIAYLFRDKRQELSELMSMLDERGTPDFMHRSLQVFGNVSDQLWQVAQAMLTVIGPPVQPGSPPKTDKLQAQAFAGLAKQEIEYLRQQAPDLDTSVRVRDDISGIMVNRGVLNIGSNYEIAAGRAQAIIQHEVGTHIVTYFNGKAQPLQLFSLGVPGYEQLQEGLAVFAEYLSGGLTNERLRVLAARVLAVRHMLMGATFVDTFHLLVDQYHFEPEAAFYITMRVHRGGGLTKDALYLQGLIELIDYIKGGNDLGILTIGKIRKDYLPIIRDLIQRGFLNPPMITPRYLAASPPEHTLFTKTQGSVFSLIN